MENFAPILVIAAIGGIIWYLTKKRKERKVAAEQARRATDPKPPV